MLKMCRLASLLVAGAMIGGSVVSASAGTPENVKYVATQDVAVVKDAFVHGYIHNMVTETVDGKDYPLLGIQCVNNHIHQPYQFSSSWTRDLYWGNLGWAQAGDDAVLQRIKSSLEVLINCKNRNKADGHLKDYPLNDGRYYIPQAFVKGGAIAYDFLPYNSESQADFLLMAHYYWKTSGDTEFIKKIWDDIVYVTKNIELMDTTGNSLPDNLWGSYDYQGVGVNTEEPLMSAKACAAYRAVAELAKAVKQNELAKRLLALANRVQETMNKPISEGGLWKDLPNGGGHYVNMRYIAKGHEGINEMFIPYENLGPMFCGVTSKAQNKAIFNQLDSNFDKYYSHKWGPIYVAPALKNDQSVLEFSTVPWLGFLDVYLRCKLGHETNRSKIFSLLIEHAYDITAAPFTEGAGIIGSLTGGAGRSWDNGNFFHCLLNGIYGINKTAKGIEVIAPTKLDGFPLTELRNVCWRDAVYDFRWDGEGSHISEVLVDCNSLELNEQNGCLLTQKSGNHQVLIKLAKTGDKK